MKSPISFVVAVISVSFATIAPAAAQTFTGPRVEAVVGWDQLLYDLGVTKGTSREQKSDFGYGVAGGYDVEVARNVIAGIEGSALLSPGDDVSTSDTLDSILHVRRDLSVAARLGTRIGANALLYGKVGYSNLQVGVDTATPAAATLDQSAALAASTYGRRNLDGVLLGVGAEVGLTDRTYLKSEYRDTNYENGVVRHDILTGIGVRF